MMRTMLSTIAVILIATAAVSVQAVEIPALREVPAAVSEPSRSQLLQHRAMLKDRLSALKKSIAAFNTSCASVDKGSAAANSCRERQGRLQAELRKYNADAVAFNRKLAAADAIGRRQSGGGPDVAVIGSIKGDVFVSTGAGDIRIGSTFVLQRGDQIRTGRHAHVELELSGGSRIRLGSDSSFKAEKLTGEFSFSLAFGTLKAMVKRLAMRRFVVSTPNVAVAVRGTEFAVLQSSEETLIEVYNGVVEASPVGGGTAVIVEAGWRLHVNSAGGNRLVAID